jgi:paraquat-inducible protein A
MRLSSDGKCESEEMKPSSVIVCETCDAAFERAELHDGETAICGRCGVVLERVSSLAVETQLAVAVSTIGLAALALASPFMTLSEAGLSRTISLLDAARALDARYPPLGLLLAVSVVGLPALRAAMQIYALAPGLVGGAPPRRAQLALRWSQILRPWAMSEIFMIGVAVSMVKVAGLASLSPGPAFYALGGAALVAGFEGAVVARETLWRAIERPRKAEAPV